MKLPQKLRRLNLLVLTMAVGALNACHGLDKGNGDNSASMSAAGKASTAYPTTEEDRRKTRVRGADMGIIFGKADSKGTDANDYRPANDSTLWHAALESLSSMPLISVDRNNGTIITDWFENPAEPGQRNKINVLVLNREPRPESLKISVFHQTKDASGNWTDAIPETAIGKKVEEDILAKAVR